MPSLREEAVEVRYVWKKYCKSLKKSMVYGLTDITRNVFGLSTRSERLREEEFWALLDVSFSVPGGEIFGIIGANGSGKSTLLKVLNGIYWPDRGEIILRGHVRALIEIAAGFHPLLTGRENIYLNAAILGLKREQIEPSIDSIVEFAGIGDFIDRPAKYYSNGMWVRLGFSVSVHSLPDILLLDEVLAYADLAFHTQCQEKLEELREAGKSIVLASHDLPMIRQCCDHVLWLERGRVREIGPANPVCDRYETFAKETAQPAVCIPPPLESF